MTTTKPTVASSGSPGEAKKESRKGFENCRWEAGVDNEVTPLEPVRLVADLKGWRNAPKSDKVEFEIFAFGGALPTKDDQAIHTEKATQVTDEAALLEWEAPRDLPDHLIFRVRKGPFRTAFSVPIKVHNPVLSAEWVPGTAEPGQRVKIHVKLELPETGDPRKTKKWTDHWKGMQVTFKVSHEWGPTGNEDVAEQPSASNGEDKLDEQLEAWVEWAIPDSDVLRQKQKDHDDERKQAGADEPAPCTDDDDGVVVGGPATVVGRPRPKVYTFNFVAEVDGLRGSSALHVQERPYFVSL